jgi:hypothetical protein
MNNNNNQNTQQRTLGFGVSSWNCYTCGQEGEYDDAEYNILNLSNFGPCKCTLQPKTQPPELKRTFKRYEDDGDWQCVFCDDKVEREKETSEFTPCKCMLQPYYPKYRTFTYNDFDCWQCNTCRDEVKRDFFDPSNYGPCKCTLQPEQNPKTQSKQELQLK